MTPASNGAGHRWLIAICVARVLLYGNFMVYAACLPVVLIEWQMSAAQAGSIASAFMVGYALSLVLSSWLADHLGAKRVVILSAVLSALSALLFAAFATSYLSALILYAIAAATQGGVYTPLIMLFADRYPPERRGRAVGWLIASTSIGYAASLLVSGAALGWSGYRLAFVATGMMPLGGAILLCGALRGTANRIHARPPASSFRHLLRQNRPARLLVTGYTAHAWEVLGMWAWMPALLAASLTIAGSLTNAAAEWAAYSAATMHMIGAAAASSMGRLSDQVGRRAVLLTLAATSTVLSFTIGWLVAWPTVILVVLGLIYSFAAVGDSPVLSTALTEVIEPGYLGAVLALRALLGFGAGAVAPLAFGLVLDATASMDPALTWGFAFGMLGLGGVIATLSAWKLDR